MNKLANILTYPACCLLLACQASQASDLASATIPAAEVARLQIESSGKVVLGKKVTD